ncbi:hypothetical protein HN51_041973 [Arachis hypogaea]|nr:uncharacterized protein LOC112697481 [Arachis hypogaea]QHN87827.1 2-hydroxy-6-oxononadienedioate/2-hydroxy-6-oxononatrienedioate hydrolase [Arachis hypogaea]QHN87828.1 2-hydroxy-6-oxononadienedioate/2-hydroxy-6-oxononatrienedioate hydrolase [Arachis hypogaea]QHN87829.1 2-hydroxy-6-oxononadienedioate/2-hydroxy-6-oxononatrienedioate hydrolase [Arachis hypogaea]RYR05752.1 hypothetical protein Ahy_B06g085569 isoform B [Arachis hypogaea]
MGTKKKRNNNVVAGMDQDELIVDPKLLADDDSCFCHFNGVEIHHKIQHPCADEYELLSHPTMILLHGFGASVFSWEQVMKPLAEVSGSKVIAFDRPAFGLTSRPISTSSSSVKALNNYNPYSMAFSVLATLSFLDLVNTAGNAILVGHSAGAAVAVNAYFEAPERVAALILVSPAILAPLKQNLPIQHNYSISNIPNSVLYNMSSKIVEFMAHALTPIMKEIIRSSRKFFYAILRSSLAIMLVRVLVDKFGTAVVRNSWYDPNQVTEHVLSAYKKPLMTKDWDRALLEYVAALLLTEEEPKTKPSLRQRLNQISCPVLIVTGDSDPLVPSWNAERLSRIIAGSSLQVIKQCGHLPHEEKPHEFISVVGNFLNTRL